MDSLVNIKGGNPVGHSKYYLNDEATEKKLKKGAKVKDFTKVHNKDDSFTLKFSTGAYITTVIPLIKFWMETKVIDEADTDGLEVEIVSVKSKMDKGGTIEGYTVRLQVEGEEVTITLWDTTLKILVQGGLRQVQFTTRALIPYLENEIDACKRDIDRTNAKVLNMTSPCHVCEKVFTDKSKLNLHIKNHPVNISKTSATKPRSSIKHLTTKRLPMLQTRKGKVQVKFQSEQQLDLVDSDENNTSSMVSDLRDEDVEKIGEITAKNDEPINRAPILMDEEGCRASTPVPDSLRPDAPSFHLPGKDPVLSSSLSDSQRMVIPDPAWLQQEEVSPTPPPVWAGLASPMPTDWLPKGGSLPCSILQEALDAASRRLEEQRHPEPVPTIEESVRPSVIRMTAPKAKNRLYPKTMIINIDDEANDEDATEKH